MPEIDQEPQRSYKIMVFGIEKVGLTPPSNELRGRNYTLAFQPYNTPTRFNDYDGVILFQSVFERIERHPGGYFHEPYVEITYDRNELDKRQKELTGSDPVIH